MNDDAQRVKKLLAELAAQRKSIQDLYSSVEDVESTVQRSILVTQQASAALDDELQRAADLVDAAITIDDEQEAVDIPTLPTVPAPPSIPPQKKSLEPSSEAARVAIGMLIRDPPLNSLHTFIRYHLALGFDHIYLYFDDISNENNDVAAMDIGKSYGDRVSVFHCTRVWFQQTQQLGSKCWYKYGHFVETDLIARQVLAIEQALRQCSRDNMDWLLHIDIDELLHCQHTISFHDFSVGMYFAHLPIHVDTVRFLNMEAAPESMELQMCHQNDYFQDVTLFKSNPLTVDGTTLRAHWPKGRNIFNAYQNGKSAVRINADVLPFGSHKFRSDDRILLSIVAKGIQVLHYPNASFELWWRKYKLLGKFPDHWCGTEKIPLDSFHMQSRNVVCCGGDRGDGDEDEEKGDTQLRSNVDKDHACELYAAHVVFNNDEQNNVLLSAGLLVRYTKLAEEIGQLWTEHEQNKN